MKKIISLFIVSIVISFIANGADTIIRNANLSKGNYDGNVIREIVNSTFVDVNIRDANLTNATIDNLKMTRGIISGSNFEGAHITNSTFDDFWPSYWGAIAKMKHLNVSNTSFKNITFSNVDFSNSKFDNVVFTHCTFTQSKFDDSSFNNVLFQDSSLTDASLLSCTFNKVKFNECDLPLANFSNSTFNEVTITKSQCVMNTSVNPPIGLPNDLLEAVTRDTSTVSINFNLTEGLTSFKSKD